MPRTPNAFYFYMKKYQNDQRKQGNNIDMKECSKQCAESWKNMSPDQREEFLQKARNAKSKFLSSILTCHQQATNVPSTANFNQTHLLPLPSGVQSTDLFIQKQQEYSDYFVDSVMDVLSDKNYLVNTRFFILATNVMVETDEKEYLPLEIGIVGFSIKDGITEEFHEFVDPGPPPLGYARLAHQHADSTHKIPLYGFPLASKNYSDIVDRIYNFLSESRQKLAGDTSPMFVFCPELACDDDMTSQNIGVLKWLWDKYEPNPGFEFDYQVLDLIYLGMKISEVMNQPTPFSIIEDRLKLVVYDFIAGIKCDFHERQENRFCALGLAKRWAYLFMDFTCPLIGINPLPNIHYPVRTDQHS